MPIIFGLKTYHRAIFGIFVWAILACRFKIITGTDTLIDYRPIQATAHRLRPLLPK